jgi:hypothetical protein
MKAAEIMKAMRQPVPWIVTAVRATAVLFIARPGCGERWEAAMSWLAKGPVRRSG